MNGMSGIETQRGAPALTPGLWVVERSASSVAFSIRHFGVATVRGGFTSFEGWLEVDRRGGGHAGGYVDVASIDTGMKARDEHLRSADCFDVARHSDMTFEADLVASPRGFGLVGGLAIMGRTSPLELAGEIASAGSGRVAVAARGVLRRREIGLQWGALLDAGAAVVGDRVSIRLDATLCRRP